MSPGSSSETSNPQTHHARLPRSLWWQNGQPLNLLQVNRKFGGEGYGRKRDHTASMMG